MRFNSVFLNSLHHPNRNRIFFSRFISENLLPMYFFLSSSVYYYYLKTENKEITQCQKICFYMWLQKPFWCYFAFFCSNLEHLYNSVFFFFSFFLYFIFSNMVMVNAVSFVYGFIIMNAHRIHFFEIYILSKNMTHIQNIYALNKKNVKAKQKTY